MPEKFIFAIAGALCSALHYVLIRFVAPRFYKGKKVPVYWQLPIPVLLLLVGNALMTELTSLYFMIGAYAIVLAIGTVVNIVIEFRKIDREAGGQG